mmetsp:Transcript_13642/g.21357  ORF Transcript_13642/g.21357 Transcript_13642/m.21357 type:complete len:111 (+) Transcript_13642:2201-2533(+)
MMMNRAKREQHEKGERMAKRPLTAYYLKKLSAAKGHSLGRKPQLMSTTNGFSYQSALLSSNNLEQTLPESMSGQEEGPPRDKEADYAMSEISNFEERHQLNKFKKENKYP